MRRVYVAASSSEISRAKRWIKALRDAGIEVTSDWPEVIEAVGDANPRAASRDDRRRWVRADVEGIRRASLFWLLAPGPDGGAARGAYVELGLAIGHCSIMVSGDTKQSIFNSVGVEHATDEAAFAEIVDRHRFYVAHRGVPYDT